MFQEFTCGRLFPWNSLIGLPWDGAERTKTKEIANIASSHLSEYGKLKRSKETKLLRSGENTAVAATDQEK